LRSFRFVVSVFALLTAFVLHARSAHAETMQWPGKLQIGLRPIGGQVALDNNPTAIYKSNIDFAGRVYEGSAISVWVGAELGIGGRDHLAVIEPGLFTRITFEKLLHIPLVPFVQAGITGSAAVAYFNDMTEVVGFIGGKVGGGVDYYVTKRVGLGVQTDFAFGDALAINNGRTQSGFGGYWDVLGGVRIAL